MKYFFEKRLLDKFKIHFQICWQKTEIGPPNPNPTNAEYRRARACLSATHPNIANLYLPFPLNF